MGTGTWPGFTAKSQSVANAAGNGLKVDPSRYTDIGWVDANNDGVISDSDTDDGAGAAKGEGVRIGATVKVVKEVAVYNDSTLTIDGKSLNVPMVAWVFEDGSFAVRINDADIPRGVHHDRVDAVRLGAWNGAEYSGTYIATRDDAFVCFTAGSMVDTDRGPVRVEDLAPGARVQTRDNGWQHLRWTGRRTLAGVGSAAPVRLPPSGPTGGGGLVSPLHRVLVEGWRAELWFGEAEILVAARRLGVPEPRARVTYVHLLFDRHEIIRADGIWSESFHPTAHALSRVGAAQRREVLALFPQLGGGRPACGPAARLCPPDRAARMALAG